MHDEDNALGLWVCNKRSEQWKAYGDKKLFEKGNENNKRLMQECLQASADEVYEAFETHKVRSPDEFKAWQVAPTQLAPSNHNPLFNEEGHYGKDCNNPSASTYGNPNLWWKWPPWEGYRLLAVKFSQADYFKKL